MGHNGRFPDAGGAQGTQGVGQGFLCGRNGVHPVPQSIRCGGPAVGVAGTQELDDSGRGSNQDDLVYSPQYSLQYLRGCVHSTSTAP